jgi:hypothetical protein
MFETIDNQSYDMSELMGSVEQFTNTRRATSEEMVSHRDSQMYDSRVRKKIVRENMMQMCAKKARMS